MQTCIWPSWCHCHSLSLASAKSRLVLPFWYRLTQVAPEKGPLNVCVCSFLFPVFLFLFYSFLLCFTWNLIKFNNNQMMQHWKQTGYVTLCLSSTSDCCSGCSAATAEGQVSFDTRLVKQQTLWQLHLASMVHLYVFWRHKSASLAENENEKFSFGRSTTRRLQLDEVVHCIIFAKFDVRWYVESYCIACVLHFTYCAEIKRSLCLP